MKVPTSGLLIIRIGASQSNYHLGASTMVGFDDGGLFALLRRASAWTFLMRQSSRKIWVVQGLKVNLRSHEAGNVVCWKDNTSTLSLGYTCEAAACF
jgi:hypothetical protein